MKENIMKMAEHPCSGCGACVAVCPKKAIRIFLDSTGFFVAKVEDNLCIRCGLCVQVCNRFVESRKMVSLYNAKLYALQSSNEKTVRKCSSGGVAHELAVMAIRKGYKVVGAVYNLKTNQVEHKIVNELKDISSLDGSKYLQSNPSEAFREAVLDAKNNSESRFYVFGTPCQIAGMDRVLKKYHIRNQFLLTEIFCHGVPSYKVWEENCKKLKKKLGTSTFDSVLFRYKKNDWHTYCLRVVANGKKYYGARETEMFWQVFFENILLSDACYKCKARKEYSSADLRIGDYWGARFQSHTDGVSAVFACTSQGKEVVEGLISTNRFYVLKESDATDMLAAQNMEGYSQQKLHDETMEILRESGNIRTAIHYYRSRMTGKQKLKRILLRISAVIPDGLRAKLRKANSSRLLKK
ncbi:Coenzyme F420 hydrogenase/dehydrogenase, beta subunit C-terminal domain [Bariatricus sp. SGI.154]|uniref:Coenzyme F420 hydrogenase/dehydrogenase, beta subunit C-terminal domain n=1 Tax=Bariatricus sp. SGI.154 TaxID=3420549 RepID=UPI003D054350